MPTAVESPEPKAARAPALYTVEDIAALLQCSVRKVRNLDYENALPGRCPVGRLVRFRVRDIDSWIAAGCIRSKEA